MSEHPVTLAAAAEPEAFDVFHRIGNLTRSLHDALKELGYDKQIESSIGSLPDARSRLSFIARLTGEAAEKVLNTVDCAQLQQNALITEANRLETLLDAGGNDAAVRAEMKAFVGCVRGTAQQAGAQLTDIMLAQDFHDLTGQTIRKVVEIATTLEDSLVQLLLDATPPEERMAVQSEGLQGPVADATGRLDVVSNQAQVDEMLESMGF